MYSDGPELPGPRGEGAGPSKVEHILDHMFGNLV